MPTTGTHEPVRIERPSAIADYVGTRFGPSEWRRITQEMIDQFAQATGDHQWIHCDPERAARELPGGKTIAHGYLTLALLAPLQSTLIEVDNVKHGLNYGADRIRFINPVPVDSNVRLTQTIKATESVAQGGVRVFLECVFDVEGAERPAIVANVIALYYE